MGQACGSRRFGRSAHEAHRARDGRSAGAGHAAYDREPSDGAASFDKLLDQAAEARRAGRLDEARARLRAAARLVAPEDEEGETFHGLLLDAADEYDEGRLRTSRQRLKSATRIINPWFWLGLGLVAQAFFTARFLVQWIASERRGESVVPVAFWYFSLLGSGGLLAYAIYRQDPVIVLGQSLNTFIYLRNLVFVRRVRLREAAAPDPSGDADS
jgi:lipid-A-disaccharide synthase-like uncharacterized protein